MIDKQCMKSSRECSSLFSIRTSKRDYDMEKKKLSTKDKTILKMIIDELQARSVTTTTGNGVNYTGTYTITDNTNEEIYQNIFDKMAKDNNGDTKYNEDTKELSIYFNDHWHREKIDVIAEMIRKKSLSAYEALEEMLEENGIVQSAK